MGTDLEPAKSGPFTVGLLSESTFPAFAAMVERNHIWGGCWCMGFHSTERRREEKEARVREGRTHAALVFDGETAIGWCQYGRAEELPRIKHRKAYDSQSNEAPDWRITCFVVDRQYRHRGVARLALQGALDEIARQGGGLVESFPEDTTGRKVSSSFLYNATASLFEKQGFSRVRKIGKDTWLMTKRI